MILIDARALQTYSYYRGIGGYIKRLINIYDNRNDFSFLLFLNKKDPEFKINNKIFVNSFTKMISFTDSFFLNRFFKNNNISIYHSTSFGLPIRVKNTKYVSTIHDLTQIKFKEFASFKNRLIQKKFIISNIKNSDIIITVSNNTKNDLIETFNLKKDNIKVIHQYIDLKDNEIKDISLPSEYIFYAGGFDKIKNVETIIKTIPLIKIPLILAGYINNKTKKYLLNLIDTKYWNLILFKGYVSKEELICYYKNASVFVFPSLYEGFGYPPLEALFFKTPVITSKKGSLKEVLREYSIYLDNPLNKDELYSKLRYVLDNSNELKQRFETDEFEKFIKYYSRERFENQMNEIYNDLR